MRYAVDRSLTDSSCFQQLSMCCCALRPSWKCCNERQEMGKKSKNVRNNICLFTSLRDLKAGEADLDIVREINWTERLSVLLNSMNINHTAMILTWTEKVGQSRYNAKLHYKLWEQAELSVIGASLNNQCQMRANQSKHRGTNIMVPSAQKWEKWCNFNPPVEA